MQRRRTALRSALLLVVASPVALSATIARAEELSFDRPTQMEFERNTRRDYWLIRPPAGQHVTVQFLPDASQRLRLVLIENAHPADLKGVAESRQPGELVTLSFIAAGKTWYLVSVAPAGIDLNPGQKAGDALPKLIRYRINYDVRGDAGPPRPMAAFGGKAWRASKAEARALAAGGDAVQPMTALVSIAGAGSAYAPTPPATTAPRAPTGPIGPDLFTEVSPELVRRWGVLALAANREFHYNWHEYGHTKSWQEGSERYEWAPGEVGRTLIRRAVYHTRGYVEKEQATWTFTATDNGIKGEGYSLTVMADGSVTGRYDAKPRKYFLNFAAAGAILTIGDKNGIAELKPTPGAYAEEAGTFDDDNQRLAAEQRRKDSAPGLGGALFGAMVGGWASGGSIAGMAAGARAYLSNDPASRLSGALSGARAAAQQEAARSNADFAASMNAIQARGGAVGGDMGGVASERITAGRDSISYSPAEVDHFMAAERAKHLDAATPAVAPSARDDPHDVSTPPHAAGPDNNDSASTNPSAVASGGTTAAGGTSTAPGATATATAPGTTGDGQRGGGAGADSGAALIVSSESVDRERARQAQFEADRLRSAQAEAARNAKAAADMKADDDANAAEFARREAEKCRLTPAYCDPNAKAVPR